MSRASPTPPVQTGLKTLHRATQQFRRAIRLAEDEASCHLVARKLHAVERGVRRAKEEIVRERLGQCIGAVVEADGGGQHRAMDEWRRVVKYL